MVEESAVMVEESAEMVEEMHCTPSSLDLCYEV